MNSVVGLATLLTLLLANIHEIELWPKSPVVRPSVIPPLCKANGKESLEYHDRSYGKVYNLAVTSSPHLGRCNPDDFEIITSLGMGGYGAVTLVEHKSTGNRYAMKIFRSNSPHRYALLRSEECHHYLATSSEAYSGKHWVSPYVAKFHCSMRLGESVRLLVEYIEGETLMAVLTGGAKMVSGHHRRMKIELKDVNIKQIFAQLVLAIEYLHDRGIVFGDLTTRNIMISKNGNIKLIDFGFSRIKAGGQNQPPTWPNGRRQPAFSENPYIDWYAVGCILYEMAYAQKLQINPNRPSKPRDVRTEITRETLLRKDCNSALGNKQLCNLIHHFIKDPWDQTWGRSAKTREAIRNHPWFKGFDWNRV